ncbi:MAG: gamma-glutamyltransferase, partial [Cyclobacteriaceae bacterium]
TMACGPRGKESKTSYAVSSATPEATRAGMNILEKGGNAIDAAVAIAFTLAVTEPAMTGLGAGVQILVSIPGKDPFVINGTTYSPQATSVKATEDDIKFHRRSTIPSFVKTLDFARQRFGSGDISWKETLEPAIDYAQNGFEMGPFRARVYKQYESRLQESPYNMSHFLIDGQAPVEGQLFQQPVLDKTLQRLAEVGADDFYHGEIAATIANDMKENGGWITLEDLNNFPTPKILPALSTLYRQSHTVFTSTPPCGGWVVLLALNLLEQNQVAEDNEQRAKNLIQTLALAHGERQKDPVRNMIDYEEEVSKKISKAKAIDLLNEFQSANTEQDLTDSGETTHFSVVDANGMAVSVTTSINAYFGSRAASKDLGFIYNSYMEDFVYGDTSHSYAVGPGKMAYSSMSPAIVRDKSGENVLALGSPGSARIISAVTQTIEYWLDGHGKISETIANPRLHVNGRKVYLEFEPSETLKAWLVTNGFELTEVQNELGSKNMNPYFGGVHAVAKENGIWVGKADPRRDGVADQR